VVAELAQVRDVALRLSVRPHAVVHGGHEQHRRGRRQKARAEKVVAAAGGRARHEVRRCRRDNHEICGAGKVDVVERMASLHKCRVHGATGQRLERHRSDEFSR
jgi:hypothetical protein